MTLAQVNQDLDRGDNSSSRAVVDQKSPDQIGLPVTTQKANACSPGTPCF